MVLEIVVARVVEITTVVVVVVVVDVVVVARVVVIMFSSPEKFFFNLVSPTNMLAQSELIADRDSELIIYLLKIVTFSLLCPLPV